MPQMACAISRTRRLTFLPSGESLLYGFCPMIALRFAAFGLFGFMYGIWQVLLAELQRSMGLSDGAPGAAATIGFVGSLPSMFFGGKLVDQFGAERVISSTAGLMALALAGVSIDSNWWALTLLLFFFFGGSGAYDVGINAAAINLEQATRLSQLVVLGSTSALDIPGCLVPRISLTSPNSPSPSR